MEACETLIYPGFFFLNVSVMKWNEHVEEFDVMLSFLRQKYYKNQTFHVVPESVIANHSAGEFRRIESRDRPTVLRSKDGGIIGYRLPALLVNNDLSHVKGLEKWVEEFQSSLPRRFDEKTRH